jgi:hypothetical protein
VKASVIISDVESQGRLLVNMHALCTQDVPASQYEVILPDLGNFTREEEVILNDFESQYPHFRVLGMPGKNRSQLLNEAARQAKGEILFFIESHCLLHRTWLKDYLEVFKDRKTQIVLGDIRTVPTDSWGGQAEEVQRMRVMRHFDAIGTASSYWDFHNAAITKKLFFEMGGLSEDIPIMAEFELGARVHQRGVPIVRRGVVWHFNDATLRNYSRVIAAQGADHSRMLSRNGRAFMERYFPSPFLKLVPLMRFLRIPLLAYTLLMIRAGIVAFYITWGLGFRRAAQACFRSFAANSHRYGRLSTLNERPRRR